MIDRDRLIPWYFVAFFLFIAIVDSVFVYLAVHTHTGLITQNSYEKGLKYNDIILAGEKQKKLGWKTDISFNSNNDLFSIKISDKNDSLITGAEVKAYVKRMVHDGYDFSVNLKETKKGIYTGALVLPLKGKWNVITIVQSGEQSYKTNKEIFVD